ncbi:AbrB/MazE/SpoVT family DNA-binding domain-containing protein [Candidatus Woesearchaeota archaeon]|nr:AbrB/MazE/SpoVT family DNA-binding domain-containing protein [Candidatus Woesearchaeota archaeon]
MLEVELKIRKWGNSFGVVLPNEIVKKNKLKEGSTIEIFIPEPKKVDFEKIFGTAHFKKSTQQLKDEMREGW